MKKLGLFAVLMFCAVITQAAPLTIEAPVKSVGTPATVTASSLTWVMIPPAATGNLSGRFAILVDVPATNTDNVVGHYNVCTGSTTVATTVRPLEFIKGNSTSVLGISDKVCLFILALDTGTETIHYQEVAQ